MDKTAVVIGASGLIGKYCYKVLGSRGWQVIGTFNANSQDNLVYLDALNLQSVRKFIEENKPSWVINCASLPGGVDLCELDPELAFKNHLKIPEILINACKSFSCHFVHFSTDYIFDGNSGPYKEDDLINPISVYGKIKAKAEQLVNDNISDALIIRTTFVYDYDPKSRSKNFIQAIIEKIINKISVNVPTDQIGNPTLSRNLAEVTIDLIENEAKGIFNVAGVDRLSKYKWAIRAAEIFGLDKGFIKGVTTPELKQVARRPLSAGFELNKIQNTVQRRLYGIDEGLKLMKADWIKDSPDLFSYEVNNK